MPYGRACPRRESKVASLDGAKGCKVTIVFEPAWTQDMMSEEAKLELGFL